MAVGKGSIIRATNASAAAEEKNKKPAISAGAETAAKEKRKTAEHQAAALASVRNPLAEIPLAEIHQVPEKWMGRRRNAGSVSELAESIRRHGMIEPVILRQMEDNRFQLLSGYRRFCAVQELGQSTITARVLEGVADQEAQEIYNDLHGIAERSSMHEAKFQAISMVSGTLPDYLL